MGTQMTIERKQAYTEILEVLKRVNESLVQEIPQGLLDHFNNNKAEEYEYNYNDDLSLSEQNLNKTTLSLLAMINLNYWCKDEEHKQELLRKYKENEERHQEELREKYNSDNVFVNKQTAEPVKENMQLVEYKEPNWFKKIFEKIKNIFKK